MKKKNNNPHEKQPFNDGFIQFIFNRKQVFDFLIVVMTVILSAVGILVCYPLPDVYPDSFTYVQTAINDSFSIYRPFGYSAFLQIVHFFSHSISAVVIMQTLLYALSITLLVLALKRAFPIKNNILRYLLEVLITLSPVAIFMLNSLMSDALFCSLVFVMLAMLIFIICDTSWIATIVFLVSFGCSLWVRYSAMFFPIAFIPALFFCKKTTLRYVSIAMICVIFGIFYHNICSNMYESVRLRQFSTGFDGWQLANNGMHVLPFIEDTQMPKDKRVKALHQFAHPAFDEMLRQDTDNGTKASASSLWNNDRALKQYMYMLMQRTGKPYPVMWAQLGGDLYAQYGKWLILHYPALFFKHYLWPNIKNVFYPPLESIAKIDEIPTDQKEMQTWFENDLQNKKQPRFLLYEKVLSPICPAIESGTWILFILALIWIFKYNQPLASKNQVYIAISLFLFGFIYYGTTTFASPVVIRYWMPMHALKLAFVWIAATTYAQR